MNTHKVSLDLSALRHLKASLVRKHLRKAVTIASRPIRQDAKTIAKQQKLRGFLARSVGIKVKTYTGTVVAIVGIESNKKFTYGIKSKGKARGTTRTAIPSRYIHFLEAGTKRATKKPVLGKAYQLNQRPFQDRVVKEFWASVEKDWARA